MRSLMRFFVQFTDLKKHDAIQTLCNNPLMKSRSIEASQCILPNFVNAVIMSFDLNDNYRSDECCDFSESYIEAKRPAAVVIYAYKKYSGGILNWLKGGKTHEDIVTFAD